MQIKQLVETFTKRSELMPADESVEQHTMKRAEEVAAVEEDRNSDRGLFKGLFSAQSLIHDEADGVHRCPTCHTEYIGGPTCLTCGTEIDGDGFDFSGEDLSLDGLDEDLELEDELELELAQEGAVHRGHVPFHRAIFGSARHFRFRGRRPETESTPSVTSNSDDSRGLNEDDSDSDDNGSLQDFVVNDDSPERRRDDTPHTRDRFGRVDDEISPYDGGRSARHISLSDDSEDDSDEAVIPPSRRTRNRGRGQGSQIVDIIDDDDDDETDEDSVIHASDRLRNAGWSPLHETDHEESGSVRQESSDVSNHSNDVSDATDEEDSDTETMMGNDESHARSNGDRKRLQAGHGSIPDPWSDDESSVMDRDGDVEMSLSPVSHEGRYGEYGRDSDSESNRSEDGEDPYARDPYGSAGNPDFRENHHVHELEYDSDESPPPVIRRRARSQQQGFLNYIPGIRQVLANHQNIRQESDDSEQTSGLEELEPALSESSENNRVEYYRGHSNRSSADNRRLDYSNRVSYRTGRAPRAAAHEVPSLRIISSSTRPSRVERRYHIDSRGPRASDYHL